MSGWLPSALRERVRLVVLQIGGALLRCVQRRAPRRIERVLVIKPDHLGDVLLLTPALRALRQQLPQAHITLLVGPWSRAVVAHNPDIDTLQTCSFPGFARRAKTSASEPYRVLLQTGWLLRSGRYDAAIIARDDHWWGALLAILAGVPVRLGYKMPKVVPFLTHALPHDATTHVTQQTLDLVGALTGTPVATRPALRSPVTHADRDWAACWLAEQGFADQPVAAIHPGTSGHAKLWLTPRWATIADTLHGRGMRVLLTGGPGEAGLVEQIAAQMQQAPLMLAGTASVGQLAAVYERCSVVLGVDSGPLHLAASVGTPTVVLFGPSNPRRYGPWGDETRHHVLRSGLWCSPCNNLERCPRGTAPSECMTLISTDQVLRTVDKLNIAD
jgi:predicted lipopolysaccharide heptosyltransferase III